MASSSSGQATACAQRISIVDVLESAADRFERRLTEETGKLRVDMARMETRLIAWMFVLWLGQIGALVTLLK
jgi:acyl-CoA reductase-like NAD-dependent aldehyde dehydrogenase